MTATANTSTIDETAPAAQAPDRLWLYALLALVATAGFFYVNIMAAIVDGLITGLGFSNPQAGTVGAANIFGASVGRLLRLDARRVGKGCVSTCRSCLSLDLNTTKHINES